MAEIPSKLIEQILTVLEDSGVPAPINDQIVTIIEAWEKTLPFGVAIQS